MDVYLKKLELQGFKSFPDRTVIKFHKGITAVIGPNGCGKSNIVDAILWVLGEQRIKNLRGENNEDLIFNGSSSKEPMGMTEVGLFLSDKDEEVYLARKFFRTGDSKYVLNEKYCRNRDIQDELFKLQLGERKYFIFEQGSIEKLISFKPTEKRILIDEAAGISQYLERKRETANKLIIAEQNLENIEILILDKNNRLRELKNQANYAQRYRNIKKEKVDYLSSLLKKKYHSFNQDFEKNNKDLNDLLNREKLVFADLANREKKILQLEEKRWHIDKQLKENQKDSYEINKKILAAHNEADQSKQKRTFLKQRLEELKGTIEKEKAGVVEMKARIKSEQDRLNDQQLKQKREKESRGLFEVELKQLTEKKQSLGEKEGQKKENFFRLQAETSRINNSLFDAEKKLNQLENEILAKKSITEELKKQIKTSDINAVKQDLTNSKSKYEEKKNLVKKIELDFLQKQEEIDGLANSLNESLQEITNLKLQKEKFFELKEKLMKDSSSENLSGKHTFIQDIIVAEKKNLPLLENFYFDELDALPIADNKLVLDSSLNKFLLTRETDISFPDEIKQEPGFICFVKDFFKLKNQNILNRLNNGVVVDNLKNGLKIFMTYGQDVVTLAAEVIKSNGVLIKNRSQGMLDIIAEIREVEKKVTELEGQIVDRKKVLELKQTKQLEMKAELDSRNSEISPLEETVLLARTKLETMEKNYHDNLKRAEISASEIELLLDEKKALLENLKRLKNDSANLEQEITGLNKDREQVNLEINKVNEEINKWEKDFLEKKHLLSLTEQQIDTYATRLEEIKTNRKSLENSLASHSKEISKIEQELSDLSKREEELKIAVKEMNQARNDLEGIIKKQEEQFNVLNQEISTESGVLTELRKKLEEIKDNKKNVEIAISVIKKDIFQLEEVSFRELNNDLSSIAGKEELMTHEMVDLEQQVDQVNEKLIKMRDSNRLNFSAESEYEILKKEYDLLVSQRDDIIKSIQDLHGAIERIDKESKASFSTAFEKIKKNFIKNFEILFGGGEAELSLTESENVLEAGLEIKAQPPGKKLQSLRLLSGGEKALTAMGFLFALFEYKPSPFCVFDEVDASLDEANIKRFLNFVHKLKEKTQFLIITHNFKTMEEADYIYGISMNEPGISTIFSMKMTEDERFDSRNVK